MHYARFDRRIAQVRASFVSRGYEVARIEHPADYGSPHGRTIPEPGDSGVRPVGGLMIDPFKEAHRAGGYLALRGHRTAIMETKHETGSRIAALALAERLTGTEGSRRTAVPTRLCASVPCSREALLLRSRRNGYISSIPRTDTVLPDTLANAWRFARHTAFITVLGSSMTAQAIEIQGHRGARGLLPENTIPAFERAIDVGVDVLEVDIGMTRDGVPVVHHDRALSPDRTRDASGAWLSPPGPLLGTLDRSELSAFDVGRSAPGGKTAERFPEQAPRDGTRIPTLADVLALGRRPGAEEIRFNIETKLTPLGPAETAGPDEFARAVVAVLRAEGMVERSNLQSFDWRVLFAARRLAPELATVCLTAEQRWQDNVHRGRRHPSPWTAGLDIGAFDGSVPKMVEAAGCAGWSPYHRDLSEEALAEAHELGLKVVVWTVNEVDEMAALARLGVDGIITDYPDRAVEALAPWRSR